RSHYVPANETVVITGDFDSALGHRLITEWFSKDPSVAPPAERHVPKDGSKGEKEKVLTRDLREKYIAVAYPIPRRTSTDVPALDILGVILGDGESSRLQEALKNKKGVVNGIETYVFTPKEEGLFVIYANHSANDRDSVLREIDREIGRIQKQGIKDWELVKARNMLRAYYVYDAETAQGRARQIGDAKTMTGDPHFIEKFLKDVDRVSADDVRKAAVKYLRPDTRRIVVMGPAKAVKNPYRKTLGNGLTCLVNRNTSSPTFSFRIGFTGGVKAEQPGRNGEFNLLARMLLKGTKNKKSSEIARQIDLLAGTLVPYNGRNLFGLSGRFLSKDVKEVLRLLKELLMETSMTERELTRVKREVLSEIRQRDDDPISFTFLRFNEAIFAGHPYSRDPMGSEKDVEALSLTDLEGVYRKYVTPHGAVLALSGDIDEKEVFSWFEELFGRWEGPESPLARVEAGRAGKEVAVEKDIQQTHMVFGFVGPGLTDKDRYAAEVLDAVLSGMGGRIHRVLREENPYAYAVTFFNQMAYETGAMGIYIGTSEKFAKDVIRIAREEIEKIRREGISEKEVQDGKNYLIGNHYIRMQSNGAIVSSMCFDALYGLDPDLFKTWPGFIEKVTKEDVDRVARRYLTLDSMVRLVVGKIKDNNK
ncbi:MAG TPA: insulinase family protein, partial [Syntrophorhabdaceae bacterium]|nr:insulinase family protein [Syntrophorhabdaceae bacterium]